jgi:NitT/TauT family transport system substrate-binding protein/putative hydroxymethylpyrimidine transport system substrate-binding protein
MRLRPLSALLAAAALCAACGSTNSGRPPLPSPSLVLDFAPNAVHAGIYAALAHRLDRADGIRLHVVVPSATTDSIELLESGRVDFAVLDIHDLALARERHAGLVGIMALVQRPLSAVIAAPPITTPRALEGRAVGITGVPSDTAVLRSIVAGAGGDPRRVRTITIGFNAVADLLAGRVAAATAFWNAEGVTLAARRPGFHTFRVDRYGAPSYPELIVCATAQTLRGRSRLAFAVVRTLIAGYALTLREPARSAADLASLVPGLDAGLTRAQLHVLLPAFRAPDGAVGQLDLGRLRSWAAWEARFGIVSRPPDVRTMFDPGLAAAAARSLGAVQ